MSSRLPWPVFKTLVKDDKDNNNDDNDGVVHGITDWFVQKLSSVATNTALGKNEFEIVWRPPLGFFEIEHAIPPGGQWLIELNPANATDFRKNAVESLLHDLDVVTAGGGGATVADQFDFSIDEFQFYLYTVDADRFDHGSWFMDIQHTRCQLQNMPTDSTSLIQKNFDVPGKTSHLTLAFQDQAEGSDTRRSRSKFKIRPALSTRPGQSSPEGQDMLLERFGSNMAQSRNRRPISMDDL